MSQIPKLYVTTKPSPQAKDPTPFRQHFECSYCGRQTRNDARFCGWCGREFGSVEEVTR